MMIFTLFAVHISDGVLAWPWLLVGFAAAMCLLHWSARGLQEDEIPRIGLLTAAFFVASLIHVRVGPTSVHLLLNGLLGVLLGRRALLALTVGLVLQAILLGHGGFTSLGINICVLALPALLARPLFNSLMQTDEVPSFRFRDGLLAFLFVLHPLLALPLAIAVFVSIVCRRRRKSKRGFQAGFFVGVMSVAMTALLNAAVLLFAGIEDWQIIAAVVLAAHVPIAILEGFIVGGAVRFLLRVKPELLQRPESQ